jgi:hypothetical protein
MKNKKLKKYTIIVGIIVLVTGVLYFLVGEFGGNSLRIRLNLLLHKEDFTEVAERFLVQSELQNIGLNSEFQIINNCSASGTSNIWSCIEGNYPQNTERTFTSQQEVLDYVGIPEDEYQYFVKFLERYHFNGIGKNQEDEYVELEDKLKGLRYYREENVRDFIPDREYLSVKRIDSHWSLFARDWN